MLILPFLKVKHTRLKVSVSKSLPLSREELSRVCCLCDHNLFTYGFRQNNSSEHSFITHWFVCGHFGYNSYMVSVITIEDKCFCPFRLIFFNCVPTSLQGASGLHLGPHLFIITYTWSWVHYVKSISLSFIVFYMIWKSIFTYKQTAMLLFRLYWTVIKIFKIG